MRLINADEAVKQLDPNTWQGEMLIAILNGLPTAYDMEKVIGQLEELKGCHYIHLVSAKVVVEDAIEIVKGGGKDE